jgi:hypothetical protein
VEIDANYLKKNLNAHQGRGYAAFVDLWVSWVLFNQTLMIGWDAKLDASHLWLPVGKLPFDERKTRVAAVKVSLHLMSDGVCGNGLVSWWTRPAKRTPTSLSSRSHCVSFHAMWFNEQKMLSCILSALEMPK